MTNSKQKRQQISRQAKKKNRSRSNRRKSPRRRKVLQRGGAGNDELAENLASKNREQLEDTLEDIEKRLQRTSGKGAGATTLSLPVLGDVGANVRGLGPGQRITVEGHNIGENGRAGRKSVLTAAVSEDNEQKYQRQPLANFNTNATQAQERAKVGTTAMLEAEKLEGGISPKQWAPDKELVPGIKGKLVELKQEIDHRMQHRGNPIIAFENFEKAFAAFGDAFIRPAFTSKVTNWKRWRGGEVATTVWHRKASQST